jgi:hypothetical protein
LTFVLIFRTWKKNLSSNFPLCIRIRIGSGFKNVVDPDLIEENGGSGAGSGMNQSRSTTLVYSTVYYRWPMQLWTTWLDGAFTNICGCFYEIAHFKKRGGGGGWAVVAMYFFKKLSIGRP